MYLLIGGLILILLIIGILVYFYIIKSNDEGDFKAAKVEQFTELLECDNSTRFEAVNIENSEDQALCDNLILDQVFLVECGNNINATDYAIQNNEKDCPGRNVIKIIDGNDEKSFNLRDGDGNKIKLENILTYKGDIGIDIHSDISDNIQMNDIKLSDGQRTTCGIKYTLPIEKDSRYLRNGKPICNFILNLNKNN